jgi:hypothetical protein
LHALTVQGKKSQLELVKHLAEQLSIAIGFESESEAAAWLIKAAVMQVIVVSLMLMANFLLSRLSDSLLSFRENLL